MPDSSPTSSPKPESARPRRRPHQPDPSPKHRALLLALTPEEWAQWRHHPVTSAYLLFLQDQQAAWRELAADLVQNGVLDPTAQHEDRNPHVIRGKLSVVADLQHLSIEGIQEFYRAQDGEEQA